MTRLFAALTSLVLLSVLSLACSDDYAGVGPYYPPYGPGTSYTCAECSGATPFFPNTSDNNCQIFATQFKCEFESYTEGSCSGNSAPSCTVRNCQIDPSSECVP